MEEKDPLAMTGVDQQNRQYWNENPIGAEPFAAEIGSREFYDQYLDYYDRFYDYKWTTFQYEKYRDRKVLEIGCGLGIDSVKFAKSGAELTCVDLSDTSVCHTRQLLDDLGLPATVCQGNAEELEFSDESFDVVYAYGVLMHVENEQKALAEVHRVLKTGGEALVVLYHRRSWFWLLKKLTGINVESEAGDPPIIRVHSVREVRRFFSAFSEVDICLDRFPIQTRRRKGLLALLFNWGFVPLSKLVPKPLMRPFGWHIIVKAIK